MRHLPIHLDLRGRTALLLGGGAALAARAALLEQAGAVLRRAETLAPEAHRKATTVDVWTPDVARWLRDRNGEEGWDTAFLLVNAIGMPSASAGAQAQKRMTAVMTYLGYEENENGKWVSALA